MITYAGQPLDDFGHITLSISRAADPPAPAQATKALVTHTLTANLYESTGAQTWDRLKSLQNICNTPEADLVITDDAGNTETIRARYVSDNTREVIARGRGVLEIIFRSWEKIDTATHGTLQATFTHADGQGIVRLGQVTGWSEEVQTEHFTRDHNARRRSTVTIDFNCQPPSIMPNPGDTRADRLTHITSNKGTFTGFLQAPMEGTLKYGNFQQTVRLDSIRPVTDDNLEHVIYNIQASYVVFPSGSYAQADYRAQASEDCETGETITTVSGAIQASTQAEALAKLAEIRTLHTTDTNQLRKEQKDQRWIDAIDTDDDLWLEMSFTLEYRAQKANFTGYTLSISTSEDVEGGLATTTYSGEVTAADLTAARTQARALGLFTDKSLVRSNETAQYSTDCDAAQKFLTLSFNYEYAEKSEFIGGTVTAETSKQTFAENTQTISGTISAPTLTQAKALARGFIPSACILRDHRETDTRRINQDTGTTFTSLNFTYTLLQPKPSNSIAGIRYTKSTEPDYDAMEETLTYQGSVFAITEADAEAAIETLITAIPAAAILQRKNISHRREQHGTSDCLVGTDFNLTWTQDITDLAGFDLITASYEINRLPSVRHAIVTPVLFGKPVVQRPPNTWTAGELTLTAQCTARTKQKALSWGQALRTKISATPGGTAGTEMPGSGRETLRHHFKNKDQVADTPQRYEYTVSFHYTYPTGLTGLMPAS